MNADTTVTASGASAAMFATRDCCVLVDSAAWGGETAALEHSHNNSDFQATKDEAGDAIVFSDNDTVRLPGGFWYRLNKSAGVAVVTFALVSGLAKSSV